MQTWAWCMTKQNTSAVVAGFHPTVLEIIFLYSQDICPSKCSFWLDILQTGLDNTLKKITQDVLVTCLIIVSDHNAKLVGHFQSLVGQSLVTNCYFQHCPG